MEATGRDGRRGAWRHGTSSTTTSGTVSSGYTSTSSRLSWISMEAARHFQEMEMEDTVSKEMEAVLDFEYVQSPKETASGKKKMQQIKILAKEFLAAPSAKSSAQGGDQSVLERWFTELDVGWVLHIADGAPEEKLEYTLTASSWIPALIEIVDIFCLTSGLSPGHGSAEEEESAKESEEQSMAEQLQLASFTQQAMLKMLAYVDFIVAPNLTCEGSFADDGVPVLVLCKKLHTLVRVCETLSKALSKIQLRTLPFYSEVERIHGEIVDVLSAKEGKMGEAIWSAMEEIRTQLLESPEDGWGSSGTQTPQGSSDIDKATRYVMVYVLFLLRNYALLEPIVSEAASLGKYVPRIGAVHPLTSLAVEMMSCLEEKLANKSEAFPEQGLRFLFLLNNTFHIVNLLSCTSDLLKSYKVDLTSKFEGYMERYVQVSWAPVLSCLINPTTSCLGKNYSPLPQFESEFVTIYTTQKLWKVPKPELRSRLRRAIMDKVIPAYRRYLADNYGNAPLKFSPSNLQEMLQELFEG